MHTETKWKINPDKTNVVYTGLAENWQNSTNLDLTLKLCLYFSGSWNKSDFKTNMVE